jgi:MerR family transcriptional regulator, light-induced transcriptional regulator
MAVQFVSNLCTMISMESRGTQFNPNACSDVPLYNIQAVAASTGVPSITLRSWERRYGVPEPKRDPKGYRLYSERDIAVTRWLRERVQEGVGISRAVNMLHVLEQGELAAPEAPALDFASLRTKLLQAINRMDEATVSRVIAEGLMVASVEEVALQLLQPTLYEVGERWATGQLSVTTEHVSSNLIRSHIAQLARISPPPLRDERIMIACAPGEFHDIGPLMLALFVRRRGFDVIYGGANIEADSFIADVLRLNPNAVCLSASIPQTAHTLRNVFAALKDDYAGILAFGGRAFNENEHLRSAVPGIYLGRDSASATDKLDAALRSRNSG